MKKICKGDVTMDEYYFPEIGRWVSIFDRLMKMYYDRGLSGYEIGWGSSSMWNICTGIPARHPRRWRSVCVWIKEP